MADNSSKKNLIPRDDLPHEGDAEREESVGPLDVPQEELGEDLPRLEDSIVARPSIPIRHMVSDDADRKLDASAESIQKPHRSVSILRKRFQKFQSLKRGYYSFIILVVLYLLSFALPLLVNNKAIVVRYNGETYFPAFTYHPGKTFGQADVGESEANYRRLHTEFEATEGNWMIMPPYPWNPLENDFESTESHPQAPSSNHWFGTDDAGRDVFARMCYGFNISISFALLLTIVNYLIGATLGGLMGFYGGKIDLFAQRGIEIWSNIPFLYTVIIISSIIAPSFTILVVILSFFGWIGISYYLRGEFLREKTKDYVAAAIALGTPDRQIIFRHILPNSLTPMIAYLPFSIIGGITALVSLDFLGFGLPVPTPSWGEMVDIGLKNKEHWWLVTTPLAALFLTLMLVTFIGEAIREAFDPRVYSRLR